MCLLRERVLMHYSRSAPYAWLTPEIVHYNCFLQDMGMVWKKLPLTDGWFRMHLAYDPRKAALSDPGRPVA